MTEAWVVGWHARMADRCVYFVFATTGPPMGPYLDVQQANRMARIEADVTNAETTVVAIPYAAKWVHVAPGRRAR